MAGPSNIIWVGGYLRVSHLDALTDIDGLSSITSIGSNLYIEENPVLCQDSVDAFIAACTTGGSVLDITGNNNGC